MFQEYENRKSESDIFSPALDLLVAWGKANLLTPENAEAKADIEAHWQEFGAGEDMTLGLSEMNRFAETALDWLSGQPCVYPDTETAVDVSRALEILDQVVLAAEAADRFPGELPREVRERIHDLMKRATIDRAPSAPRLVPLNDWRRAMLAHVPKHLHFLFPWYADWSELPADIVEKIIECQSGAADDSTLEIFSLPEGELNAFLAELSEDSALANYIRGQIRTARRIQSAIGQSFGLRLFILADKEAGLERNALPDSVREKGLVTCARRALRNLQKKFVSEADRLEARFLAAFCGPMLSEKDRLDHFRAVEGEMDSLSPALLSRGNVLHRVAEWREGRLDGAAMAETLFVRWINELEEASAQVAGKEEETREAFLRELDEVLSWTPAAVFDSSESAQAGLWEKIKANFTPDFSAFFPKALATARLSESAEKTDIFFPMDSNHFSGLPIVYRGGKMAIPGRNESLDKVNDLLKKTRFFWNAAFRLKGETEMEWVMPAPAEEEGKAPFYRLKKAEYAEIVACISPSENLVQKVMVGESLTDKEKSQIIFLHYTAEEE